MNTSKIIKGAVSNGRYTVTAPIVKEDYGLYLKIEGVELPETYQVDFSNSENSGTSVTMIGNADGVLIPRQFISTGKDVFAFLYHVGADYGRTVYKFRIPNKLRPDRTNEEPTPEEQSVIDQTLFALNEAVEQTSRDVVSADQSAQSASDDADRAERAKTSAETAQGKAEEAQESAERAKDDAETSERNASESQRKAKGYAETASEKADAITGLTATATTLPSGSSASASYDAQTGVMSFGIPKGKDGTNGDDGYSPTASVTKSGKVATITITDKTGTTSAQVEDGTDGTDGVSPTVSITPITGGHRIAITDADGTEMADVMDGDDYILTEEDKEEIADMVEVPSDWLKAFPTDTASGAVASFTDGADNLPLKSLVVDINPIQDTSSGDPSPENVCPISGWTQVGVNQRGKNLLDADTYGNPLPRFTQGITFSKSANGNYHASGTATGSAFFNLSFNTLVRNAMPATPFIGKNVFISTGNSKIEAYIGYFRQNGTFQQITNGSVIPSDAVGFRCYAVIRQGTVIDDDFYPQIEFGSTATPYSPYTGRSITIDLGQTVYGAKLYPLEGKALITMTMVDMGTIEWRKSSSLSSVGGSVFTENVSAIGDGMTSRERYTPNNVYSDVFATCDANTWYISGMLDYSMFVNQTNLFISASAYETASDFKTAMSGVQLCYELAEPIEIQLSANQINSLLGVNNIWADTGDTALEYRADPDLYIQRKMPDVPVDDVQINGTSIVQDGVADIPYATLNAPGVVRVGGDYGVGLLTSGSSRIVVSKATDAQIKSGDGLYRPIVTSNQHQSVFYGLAKSAGDTTQSQSSNAVGNYTEDAKVAIQKMLGVYREWELIADVTVEEDSAQVDITADASGQSFALREAFVRVWLNPSTTGANDYVSAKMLCEFNNGIVSVGSLPTLRYMANGAKTFMEYKAELIDGIGHAVGSATSSPSTTGALNRIDNEVVDIKHYYGFRIGRYSSSTTLIPAGTIIKIYGIRA